LLQKKVVLQDEVNFDCEKGLIKSPFVGFDCGFYCQQSGVDRPRKVPEKDRIF
jgi:hypothetical protein